jgi:hypothetical protein
MENVVVGIDDAVRAMMALDAPSTRGRRYQTTLHVCCLSILYVPTVPVDMYRAARRKQYAYVA